MFVLFFSSGISGLMYQVVWLRMLARTMGVTIYATATILAAFMAGLALGSYLLGRIIDKRDDPLRVYSVLEMLIGLTALLVPLGFALAQPVYLYIYNLTGESELVFTVLRAVFLFLLLLIPTTMMGGTLPVLSSWLIKRDRVFGKSFSLLYGINTLGAVAGVFISGFITIGAFGEQVTIFIGVVINLLVALMAYLIYTRERGGDKKPIVESQAPKTIDEPISPYPDYVRVMVLIAFAISGFTALAYEVIWARQLIIFLKTSVYAFSGMLTIFLAGIALGSIFMNRIVDRLKSPLLLFGIFEVIVGILSIVNLNLFAPMDGHFFRKLFGVASVFYATVIIVFPMTFVFGMIFPIAGRCFAKSIGKAGSSVGILYSANTIGSILGSVAAGFLLIPLLGATETVVGLAIVNALLGVTLFAMDPQGSVVRKMAYGSLGLLVLIFSTGFKAGDPFLSTVEKRIVEKRGMTWLPPRFRNNPDTYEIFYHKEGIQGTVTAFSFQKYKQLWINGVGMTFLCTETKLMAHLPLMFVEEPKEILFIAFGMGTSIRSAALYPDLNITAVELVPETFETFRYYHEDSEAILQSKNVHPIVNDGRNHLLMSPKRYDVISVDPSPPIWSAGTVNLYTKEFFELAKSRLTDDGVMNLWFPEGTEDEIRSVMKTFHEVFPYTTVWSGPHYWGFYIIGTLQEKDWDRFRRNAQKAFNNPEIIKDLSEYDQDLVSLEQLEPLLLWDKEELQKMKKGGILITDNNPYTEFPLWRYLFKGRKKWHPQYALRTGN